MPYRSNTADADARSLLDHLGAARLYVQDCIDNGHDRAMLANLYGARDELDAAIALARAA